MRATCHPRFHNLRSTFNQLNDPWLCSFVHEIGFGQNAERPIAVGIHITSEFSYLLGCHIDIRWHESKHDRPWDHHTSQDRVSSKSGIDDPAALIHSTAVIHACRPWMTLQLDFPRTLTNAWTSGLCRPQVSTHRSPIDALVDAGAGGTARTSPRTMPQSSQGSLRRDAAHRLAWSIFLVPPVPVTETARASLWPIKRKGDGDEAEAFERHIRQLQFPRHSRASRRPKGCSDCSVQCYSSVYSSRVL